MMAAPKAKEPVWYLEPKFNVSIVCVAGGFILCQLCQ